MAHRPAAFRIRDRVKITGGARCTVVAAQETPFGWRYRVTGSGTEWYSEHLLRLDSIQWTLRPDGASQVSGKWMATTSGHLWYGDDFVGTFDYPTHVAEDTQDLWDERQR